ncbi:MAG TPA: hypothetical protein VGW38_22175 [Chloroflexota bacterium]|nr:hypothetical protein [Chloroflexota bacterium]
MKGCTKCGLQFQWEHKESKLLLPELNAHTPGREERFAQLVHQHLASVEQEGWQADGPVEWAELLATGRIEQGKNGSGGGPPIETFRSVTLPLKKLHLIRHPIETPHPGRVSAGMTPDEAARRPRTG